MVGTETTYRVVQKGDLLCPDLSDYWRKHRSDIEFIYNGMKLNDLNLNPMEVFE